MGALLQKMLGGGPLLQLDHVEFECCNDEVRSSSSSDSWHTHASGHVQTAREGVEGIDGTVHEMHHVPPRRVAQGDMPHNVGPVPTEEVSPLWANSP